MNLCAVFVARRAAVSRAAVLKRPTEVESLHSSSHVSRLPSAFHPTLLAAPAPKAPCNSARMSACTSYAASLHAQLCFHLHVAALHTPPLYPALLAADYPLPFSCAAFACSICKPFKVGSTTGNIPPCQAASYARASGVKEDVPLGLVWLRYRRGRPSGLHCTEWGHPEGHRGGHQTCMFLRVLHQL